MSPQQYVDAFARIKHTQVRYVVSVDGCDYVGLMNPLRIMLRQLVGAIIKPNQKSALHHHTHHNAPLSSRNPSRPRTPNSPWTSSENCPSRGRI